MFKTRLHGLSQVFHLIQLALALGVYALAVQLFVTFYHSNQFFDYESYILMGGILGLALFFSSYGKHVERINLLHSSVYSLHDVCFRRTATVLMFQLAFLFVAKNDSVSRLFLVIFTPALYTTLLITYRTLPQHVAKLSYSGERTYRTLLVGNHHQLPNIKHWLDHKSALGLSVVGLLTDEADASNIHHVPVLGTTADLEKVITEHQIAQVILMHIPEPKTQARAIYHITEKYGARLMIFNDLQEVLGHSIDTMDDDGLNFIAVRTEPLESMSNRMIKRAMDVAIAIPVIVLVFPILVVAVKLCHWLQSPGPLLHKQVREGMQNRRFQLFKFRTMHVHSEPITIQAESGDRRVFPLGALMRRFSIDEFPQFINVLMGDMSVVGPRPHLPEHNKDFSLIMGHYHVRSYVKPGITGLAQVRGLRGPARNKGALIGRVVSDLFYIENWSVLMDLSIIARTVVQILFPPKTAV